LQQLSLEIVSDDIRPLFMNRLANTVARVAGAVLTNGVNGLLRHSREGSQRSEGVCIQVEKMLNPSWSTIAVSSSVLDGVWRAGSEVELLRRHVLIVHFGPGVGVEGDIGIADGAVEARNLAGNRKKLERAHWSESKAVARNFSVKCRS
jgi:hypothetical protein